MGAPSPAVVRAHRRVLATTLLLAGCIVASALRGAEWPGNAALALVLLSPLLVPLPGLLRSHRRTHAWATLCVAPYLVFGITEVVANPAARIVAGAMLFASLALFVALVGFLRVTRPGPDVQRPAGS